MSCAGEIEYRRGAFDAAFAHLRASVKLDDDLPYDEPWGWMQPTRHALGALLLEQVHRPVVVRGWALSHFCASPMPSEGTPGSPSQDTLRSSSSRLSRCGWRAWQGRVEEAEAVYRDDLGLSGALRY
jgi:hypothetical protein